MSTETVLKSLEQALKNLNQTSLRSNCIPNSKKSKIYFDSEKEPSKTKSEFKNESDINVLMKKYSGEILSNQPFIDLDQIKDYTTVPTDYQTAMDYIANVKSAFEEYPSRFRERFQNSPKKFLDYLENPENINSLIKEGFATPVSEPSSIEDGGAAAPSHKAGKAPPKKSSQINENTD